jgi:hypothetical protein
MVLHPDDLDDPQLFRVDLSELGMGTLPVVFTGTGNEGQTPRLWFDLMAFDKRPDVRNPRRLAAASVLTAGAALLAAQLARRGTRHDELS